MVSGGVDIHLRMCYYYSISNERINKKNKNKMKTIKINKDELVNAIIECGRGTALRLKINPTNGKFGIYANDNSATYTEVGDKQVFWDYIDLFSGFEDWSGHTGDEHLEEVGLTREEYEQEVFEETVLDSVEEWIESINYNNGNDEEAPTYELI